MEDTRNVIDKYKSMPMDDIIARLDAYPIGLEIAIENLERDFNMGTIVRSANAFGVRHVHVIGRRQWNKRGAMMTDKYLHLHYHNTPDDFLSAIRSHPIARQVIVVDNVKNSVLLSAATLPMQAVLIFGSEGSGVSQELRDRADQIVAIEQFGSTRSLNVGVAAGVVMYEWTRRNHL